jgi:hypothetical protein
MTRLNRHFEDNPLRQHTSRRKPHAVAAGQADDAGVHGYVLPSGLHSPPNNTPTLGEFLNALTNYVGAIVGAPLKVV